MANIINSAKEESVETKNTTNSVILSNKWLRILTKVACIITGVLKWLSWICSAIFIPWTFLQENTVLRLLLPGVVIVITEGFLFHILHKILKDILSGKTPFSTQTVKRLMTMGHLQLFSYVYTWIYRTIINNMYNIEATINLKIGENLYTSKMYGSGNDRTLLLIFLFYILALVFEYGVRLQQQADETL